MSRFFKALEQAEHEQALRRQTAPVEPAPAPRVEPAPVPSSAGTWPPPQRPVSAARASAPAFSSELDERLVSMLAPTSFEAEQYRALRHRIEQLHKTTDLAIVAVSSPSVADGKTTTAINLAGALAQAPDARVLLIDADLREGSLARRLGLDVDMRPGLVEAILDPNLTLDAVAHVDHNLNLSVLTGGRLPSAPYEVLKAPRVGELLGEARRRYDYIVLDTPPLVSVPDCRVIGRWVDGFLIVVTAHKTPRKLLEEALHVTEGAKILGLVFNGDDRHVSRGYSYGSGRRSQTYGRASRRQTASDD